MKFSVEGYTCVRIPPGTKDSRFLWHFSINRTFPCITKVIGPHYIHGIIGIICTTCNEESIGGFIIIKTRGIMIHNVVCHRVYNCKCGTMVCGFPYLPCASENIISNYYYIVTHSNNRGLPVIITFRELYRTEYSVREQHVICNIYFSRVSCNSLLIRKPGCICGFVKPNIWIKSIVEGSGINVVLSPCCSSIKGVTYLGAQEEISGITAVRCPEHKECILRYYFNVVMCSTTQNKYTPSITIWNCFTHFIHVSGIHFYDSRMGIGAINCDGLFHW